MKLYLSCIIAVCALSAYGFVQLSSSFEAAQKNMANKNDVALIAATK